MLASLKRDYEATNLKLGKSLAHNKNLSNKIFTLKEEKSKVPSVEQWAKLESCLIGLKDKYEHLVQNSTRLKEIPELERKIQLLSEHIKLERTTFMKSLTEKEEENRFTNIWNLKLIKQLKMRQAEDEVTSPTLHYLEEEKTPTPALTEISEHLLEN